MTLIAALVLGVLSALAFVRCWVWAKQIING